MGLEYIASVLCDKCGITKTTAKVVVTMLKPRPEMHLKLPEAWVISSKPESGELLITCPRCPPVLVSIPPSAVVEDPATDPTMLQPPPLPKRLT
jgi:hypothetical protein